MMTSSRMIVAALLAVAVLTFGCDMLGGGQQQQQQAIPGVATMPGQPAVPGVATMPGQPAVPGVATMPGQPVVPGVAAMPGQPAVPGVVAAPAQPVAAPAPTPPMPTGDVLTDRMNTAQFNRAQDWKATSALERVPVTNGERKGYEVVLPGPPFCHTYIAVAEDGITEFAVTVESPEAAPEGTAAWPAVPGDATHMAVIADHCPTVGGTYKVFFENKKGAGSFALQVFSKSK